MKIWVPRRRAHGGSGAGLLAILPPGVRREGLVVEQHIREGRFQRGLALIAGCASLLSGLEVTYEHYRGSYSQRIMWSPVLLSPALCAAAIWGAFSRRAARTALPIVSALTILDGLIGVVFHIRGVNRKPGGWRLPVFNIIMGPPLFAPALFAISGYLGLIAAFLRRADDPSVRAGLVGRAPAGIRPRPIWLSLLPQSISREGVALEQHVHEGRFQKQLAVAAALAALFNGIESLYSHYRNGFSYRSQWIPIALSPCIIVAGIGTVWSRTIARTLLPLTSLLSVISGGIGVFYHVRGVLQRPGGLRLPLINVIYGPPVFAPLLYVANGFLGLLASLLRRAD